MSKRRFPGMKAADKFEKHIPGTGVENFDRWKFGLSENLAYKPYIDRMAAATGKPDFYINKEDCLLDRICNNMQHYKGKYPDWAVKAVLSSRYTARRFVFDKPACLFIGGIIVHDAPLVMKNAEFARPPYDCMYMQFNADALYAGEKKYRDVSVGMLIVDNIVFVLAQGPYDEVDKYYFVWTHRAFKLPLIDGNVGVIKLTELPGDADGDLVMHDPLLATTALLLLNRPSDTIILKEVAASRVMRHNKSVAFAAHTVVNINLKAKLTVRRLLMGDRSSPRRHDVRGHWVHWHHVRECEHEWQALTGKDGMGIADKFKCDKCGTLRVWRKNFLRGDGLRGVVTKDYAVHP